MTRSNGPATQPGAWPQQQQRPVARPQNAHPYPQQPAHYEQDHAQSYNQGYGHAQAAPQGHDHAQNQRWDTAHQQGGAAYQGGGWPPAAPPHESAAHQQPLMPHQGGYAQPDPRTQPPAYSYPPVAEPHDPYAHQGFAPPETTGRPYAPAPAYAPQFDPYTPPTGAPAFGAQQGYAQPAAYQPPPAFSPPAASQELSSLQQRAPQAPAAPDLRGSHFDPPHDQWHQSYGAPPPAAADPHGYDLGGYSPAQPDSGMQPHPAFDGGHHAAAHGGFGGHAAHQAGHQTEWGAAERPYDPYDQQMGYQHAPQPDQVGSLDAGVPQGHQLEPAFQNEAHEDLGEYEYDEPRSGRRWGLIAASLVGAIAIGAGLSYGYKMVLGPDTSAATPVVKNSASPAKVKPAEPGGKQFAHTDSKIMGRLNDQSPAQPTTEPAADTDSGGARKVQTIVIGRDGSVVPSAQAAEIPPTRTAAASPQQLNVPGMTIVDGFGGRPPTNVMVNGTPPSSAPSPAASMPAAGVPQPARPVVVTPPAAKPTVVARAAPVTAAEADPTPVMPRAAAAKAPVAKKTAAVAAAPVATGSNGFVAVLASVPASQKSSLDALKQFADMQQRYGSALSNKTPEVRETNLGEKGTYHRLLVGPPGSREQAGQLCSQLKAQGYGSCWVTAY